MWKRIKFSLPSVQARSVFDSTEGQPLTDCPEHVQSLLEQTQQCGTVYSDGSTADGLWRCFSTGDTDVGRMDLVQHSIPPVEWNQAHQTNPRQLGAKKD